MIHCTMDKSQSNYSTWKKADQKKKRKETERERERWVYAMWFHLFKIQQMRSRGRESRPWLSENGVGWGLWKRQMTTDTRKLGGQWICALSWVRCTSVKTCCFKYILFIVDKLCLIRTLLKLFLKLSWLMDQEKKSNKEDWYLDSSMLSFASAGL